MSTNISGQEAATALRNLMGAKMSSIDPAIRQYALIRQATGGEWAQELDSFLTHFSERLDVPISKEINALQRLGWSFFEQFVQSINYNVELNAADRQTAIFATVQALQDMYGMRPTHLDEETARLQALSDVINYYCQSLKLQRSYF